MRTARTIADFGTLTAAEQKILDELDTGEGIRLGKGSLPAENAGDDRQVRARFLRYLALGGCENHPTHEKGLRIQGALIKGALDLESCDLGCDLIFVLCRFLQTPVFIGACLNNLSLKGSHLHHGLSADGLQAKGNVLLNRIRAEGEVRFSGATLGRDLECDGAKFNCARDANGKVTGYALIADRLQAKGNVSLDGITAEGEVRFTAATLGGDLDCDGAKFNGARDANGKVTGYALSLQNTNINGALLWRDGTSINGVLDLTGANVGVLLDDAACWPDKGHLLLDGFRYGRIINAPVDAKSRLEWLKLQEQKEGEFTPQPYEQLAKVLREMGHLEDARAVLIAKERSQREARRARLHWIRRPLICIKDGLLNITVRYGHRPLQAFWLLLGLYAIGVCIFAYAAGEGAFKPNNPRVLMTDQWADCADIEPSQMACFLGKVPSYPQFNALIYSADTVLPVVDLEMQKSWIPDESQGIIGRSARVYLWFQIFMGWLLSLLALAGFAGLVKSD